MENPKDSSFHSKRMTTKKGRVGDKETMGGSQGRSVRVTRRVSISPSAKA